MTPRPGRTAAYWLAPMAFCLLLHHLSFQAWFRADDFAWLGLALGIHSWHDLASALFSPRAQGTIRPLSERLFFILGYRWFGLDSLPYRLVIFATQFADLALMMAIAARIARTRAAGLIAAALWMLNSASVQPLGWACVYNEVLCGFFLLSALYARIRHDEAADLRTRRRFQVLEWAAFLLGFGALEISAVYPAIAAAWSLCFAPKRWRNTLPMFAVSAVYAAIHRLAAPVPATGPYAMHFGPSMLKTIAIYWTWTIGPAFNSTSPHIRRWMLWTGLAAISLALVWFAWRKLRDGSRAPLFCAIWYAAALAPLIPLRDHLTEYYPYIPEIGICWLAGWALAEACRSRTLPRRAAAVALAVVYCVLMVPQLRGLEGGGYGFSQRAEELVTAVAAAHQQHPGKVILLEGVDRELFWSAVESRPFRLVGADRVYLSDNHPPAAPDVQEFILPAAVAVPAAARGDLVAYEVHGPILRDITAQYASTPPQTAALPSRISAADPLDAALLGPGWHELEGDHRWTAKRAEFRIAAPAQPGRKLYLTGNCDPAQLQQGPLNVTLTIDGAPAGQARIDRPDFELALPLPDAVVGHPEMRVEIEVDRTLRPPADSRELGLAFGTIEVR